MAKISRAELDEIVAASLPWAADMGLVAEDLGEGTCRARAPFDPRQVRPGGSLSGPFLIAAASYAGYFAVLAAVGRIESVAAIGLNCTYLRPGPPAAVLAAARVVSRTRRLAYVEVALTSEADPDGAALAQVTMTFAIPAQAG